jgi:hypothetical protein
MKRSLNATTLLKAFMNVLTQDRTDVYVFGNEHVAEDKRVIEN